MIPEPRSVSHTVTSVYGWNPTEYSTFTSFLGDWLLQVKMHSNRLDTRVKHTHTHLFL